MAIKILQLDGLSDDALCRLTEQMLATLPEVTDARIDSFSQKLTLTYQNSDSADLVAKAERIVRKVMPDVSVKLTDVSDLKPPPPPRPSRAGWRPEEESERPGEEDEDDGEYEEDEDDGEPNADVDGGQEDTAAEPAGLPDYLSVQMFEFVLSLAGFLLARLLRNSHLVIFFSVISYALCILSILFPYRERWFKLFRSPTIATMLVSAAFLQLGQFYQAVLALLVYRAALFAAVCLYGRLDGFDGEDDGERMVLLQEEGVPDRQAPVSQVGPGETILIQPGEEIPFDGVIARGESQIRPTILSAGKRAGTVGPGDEVCCGDLNLDSLLSVTISGPRAQSLTYRMRLIVFGRQGSRLPDLVKRRELIVTLLLLAVGMAVFELHPDKAVSLRWVRGLSALLALCPLGLAAAAGAAQSRALGRALQQGMLIRGARCLERLAEVKTLLIGYTGILSGGKYHIYSIEPGEEANWQDVLEIAALFLRNRSDPLAQAVVEEYQVSLEKKKAPKRVEMLEQITGLNMRGMYDQKVTLVGDRDLMDDIAVEVPVFDEGKHCLYIAMRGEYFGSILLDDPVKPGLHALAATLKARGVERVGIFSDRRTGVLRAGAAEIEADEVYSVPTPERKRELALALTAQIQKPQNLAFTGHLASLDRFEGGNVKITLGDESREEAICISDALIPNGDPLRLPELLRIARFSWRMPLVLLWVSLGCKAALLLYLLLTPNPSIFPAALGNAALLLATAVSATLEWKPVDKET